MSSRLINIERSTRETSITLSLDFDVPQQFVDTGLPFFDHILTSMAYHGFFGLTIKAEGDIQVDAHHLVEDVGIALGNALRQTVQQYGHVERYGQSLIPMDEALSEVIVDVSGRPYLVYNADYPQEYCGQFPTPLIREFLYALAHNAQINLHAHCRYGENSHHMVEALFKALGRAFMTAYRRSERSEPSSTKGVL